MYAPTDIYQPIFLLSVRYHWSESI